MIPKTLTLGTDLSVRTSHSCQILIFFDEMALSIKGKLNMEDSWEKGTNVCINSSGH